MNFYVYDIRTHNQCSDTNMWFSVTLYSRGENRQKTIPPIRNQYPQVLNIQSQHFGENLERFSWIQQTNEGSILGSFIFQQKVS